MQSASIFFAILISYPLLVLFVTFATGSSVEPHLLKNIQGLSHAPLGACNNARECVRRERGRTFITESKQVNRHADIEVGGGR